MYRVARNTLHANRSWLVCRWREMGPGSSMLVVCKVQASPDASSRRLWRWCMGWVCTGGCINTPASPDALVYTYLSQSRWTTSTWKQRQNSPRYAQQPLPLESFVPTCKPLLTLATHGQTTSGFPGAHFNASSWPNPMSKQTLMVFCPLPCMSIVLCSHPARISKQDLLLVQRPESPSMLTEPARNHFHSCIHTSNNVKQPGVA